MSSIVYGSHKLSLPLSLLITGKDPSEQDFIAYNILKFYNLIDLNEKPNNIIESQSLNLIEHLNFIRLSPDRLKSSNDLNNASILTTNQFVQVPSFSCILLTNNPTPSTTTTSFNANRQTKDAENNLGSGNNLSQWSYHHKVELTDKNGQTIAQQLFYRLTPALPLFSRSNWQSPLSTQQTTNPTNLKFIVRLNINCKNFDLMLFFYRLLFDKCANYSKKDFSLFILKTAQFQHFSIEYQLSLKNDRSVSVQTADNQCLIYTVKEASLFRNIIRLLDGFIDEIINGRVYCVHDPDRNKVYIIDSSLGDVDLNELKKPFSTSTGLVCKYLNNFNRRLNNVFSLNSPNSNSSSDSGNWSCSTKSQKKSDQIIKSDYKKMHRLIKTDHDGFVGVKNLIKKFTDNCNLDEERKVVWSNDAELDFFMKQASNNKNFLFVRNMTPVKQEPFKIEEVNVRNHLPRQKRSKRRRANLFSQTNVSLRSSSTTSINSITSSTSSSSSSSSSTADLTLKSAFSTKNSKLNRKKSKSVTFLDTFPSKPTNKPLQTREKICQRPKSTLAFRHGYLDHNTSLIDLNHEKNNYFDLFRHDLNESVKSRPKVGVTAESRHRKTHTLDMLRSTKMPLGKQDEPFLTRKKTSKLFAPPSKANFSHEFSSRNKAVSESPILCQSADILNQFSQAQQSKPQKQQCKIRVNSNNVQNSFDHEANQTYRYYIPVAKF